MWQGFYYNFLKMNKLILSGPLPKVKKTLFLYKWKIITHILITRINKSITSRCMLPEKSWLFKVHLLFKMCLRWEITIKCAYSSSPYNSWQYQTKIKLNKSDHLINLKKPQLKLTKSDSHFELNTQSEMVMRSIPYKTCVHSPDSQQFHWPREHNCCTYRDSCRSILRKLIERLSL